MARFLRPGAVPVLYTLAALPACAGCLAHGTVPRLGLSLRLSNVFL